MISLNCTIDHQGEGVLSNIKDPDLRSCTIAILISSRRMLYHSSTSGALPLWFAWTSCRRYLEWTQKCLSHLCVSGSVESSSIMTGLRSFNGNKMQEKWCCTRDISVVTTATSANIEFLGRLAESIWPAEWESSSRTAARIAFPSPFSAISAIISGQESGTQTRYVWMISLSNNQVIALALTFSGSLPIILGPSRFSSSVIRELNCY